ncbi:MAG: hypothetical protein GX224_05075 [Thermoplasmatales archaeon]|nr:hypothetical protein [Thermoplasmatales archaeon]
MVGKIGHEVYKVVVHAPPGYEDAIMDAVDSAVESVYPGYRRTFSVTDTVGTWMPVEGANPFLGTVGEIETANERRIEFIAFGKDLRKAVAAIVSAHPYEEPAIDIIPMVAWKSFL